MTNDEAIKTLREDYCGNRIICELYPDQCNREDCEIWLAIKALAEQPIRVLETQPDGDAVSRKDAIRIVDSIDTWQAGWRGDAIESLKALPSAQPERRCVNCGRTVNNGGWYEDGRTRCPIEEHYALPKDGYCHLWEKRKDWEDDYVKRAEEGEK